MIWIFQSRTNPSKGHKMVAAGHSSKINPLLFAKAIHGLFLSSWLIPILPKSFSVTSLIGCKEWGGSGGLCFSKTQSQSEIKMTNPLRHGEKITINWRETDIEHYTMCPVLLPTFPVPSPSVSLLSFCLLSFLPIPMSFFPASSPYVLSLSLPPLLQTLCLVRSHKEIMYSCPPSAGMY